MSTTLQLHALPFTYQLPEQQRSSHKSLRTGLYVKRCKIPRACTAS